MSVPLRVGLLAGEASGDTLGADLIHALRRMAPQTEFFGVAGPKMQAAGCEVWEPSESLAVMAKKSPLLCSISAVFGQTWPAMASRR